MRTVLLVLALSVACLTATPAIAQQRHDPTHRVAGTWLDPKGETWLALRRHPRAGKSTVTIAQLTDGTPVKVLVGGHGKKGKWLHVYVTAGPHRGKTGYVHGDWLARIGPGPKHGPKTTSAVMVALSSAGGNVGKLLQFVDPGIGLLYYEHTFGGRDGKTANRGRRLCGKDLSKYAAGVIGGGAFPLEPSEFECLGNYCSWYMSHSERRWVFGLHQGRIVLWLVADLDGMLDDGASQRQEKRFVKFVRKNRKGSCR